MQKATEFNIQDAAHILDVHLDTIKYWEKKKLIPEPRRNKRNNYRVYSVDEIKEIAKIRGIYEIEIDSVIRKIMRNKSY